MASSVSFHTNMPYGTLRVQFWVPFYSPSICSLLVTYTHKYNVQCHCYADDTQVYIPRRSSAQSKIATSIKFLHEIGRDLLAIPKSRLKTKGDRVLAGPTLWNNLQYQRSSGS